MIRTVDTERFARTMAAVAVATRTELDEPMMELYFAALEDIPMELVEAGSIEVVKGIKYWPTVAEWRLAVDAVLEARQRLIPAGQLALAGPVSVDEYRCEECDNTGWAERDFECQRHACRPKDTEPDTIHTHHGVVPCTDQVCLARRALERNKRRRYAKAKED